MTRGVSWSAGVTGKAIPSHIDSITNIQSDAEFILVRGARRAFGGRALRGSRAAEAARASAVGERDALREQLEVGVLRVFRRATVFRRAAAVSAGLFCSGIACGTRTSVVAAVEDCDHSDATCDTRWVDAYMGRGLVEPRAIRPQRTRAVV